MKTFCSLPQYQTLPTTYRNSTFSLPNEPSPPIPILKLNLYTLPPRPKVSRSFSFSESQITDSNNKFKTYIEQQPNINLTRTHSLYGLQVPNYSQPLTPELKHSPYQYITPHRGHNVASHTQIRQFQPLSRSLSLVSLQPPQLSIHHNPKHDDQDPPDLSSARLHTRAPSIGHIYQNSQTDHAGIWSRGRRAESCRNLRDLSDHDGTFDPSVSKGSIPTKVDPPKAPVRLKKNRREETRNQEESSNTGEYRFKFASSPAQSSSSSLGGWSEDSSSCQNSSSSTDSGRGSDSSNRTATIHGCYNRYSQLSSPQFSSSSSSSSSLFSSPPTFAQGKSLVLPTPLQTRPDAQSPGPPTWGVGKSGTTHSASLLICWLDSLQFSCYHSLFLSAGYDLPTISRMTPEDLTAIGIQHPGHRKKLKQAISQLNIPDGLPDFLPNSLTEWLRMIRLEEYGPGLLAQGYNTVKDVVTISIEDLEDVGFYRLGHQKRLLLAIKKIKDVSQGSQKMTEEEKNCIYQTQEITLPSLVPGITRHDKFSSFHQPVPSQDQDQSSFQSQKLPQYCSPYTTYGQQDDLPPPLPEPSSPSQCASTPSDELLPPVPEPMQPLHYSLYRPTTDISQHMKSAPGMFRSHDENLILRRLSSGGGILQPKDHRKAKPVAMVAANARTSQIPYADSCHLKQSRESSSAYSWDKGRQSEMKSPHECQNISLARSWKTSDSHNPHLLRRNSITCLPVSNNMEEVLNVKARNSINTNINNSEETKRLMSKSGPSSPNQTLTRRNRTNSRLSIPDGDKSSYFHGHSSAAQSGYATPERSRSRSAGDVLQDIGSMLSDLTDELDAMLNMEGEQSD